MRSWMIGLLLGILQLGLWPALPQAPVLPAMAALAALRLAWRQVGPVSLLLSGLLLGGAVAIHHGQALLDARLPEACVGELVTLQGVIASLPRHSRFADGGERQRFEFQVDALQPSSCSGPRRLLLSYYGEQRLQPGQAWVLRSRLRRPWGLSNPGSFNMQAWYAASGIDALGSVIGNSLQPGPPPPAWRYLHHGLRQRISARIESLELPAGASAILRAVTVADRSGIDSQLWTLVRQWGVTHLLVISGLHVGLVAGFGLLLGGIAARGLALVGISTTRLPAITALLLAAAYAALAGFTLPTVRALCMVSAFVIASLCSRASASGSNLLLAAVLVLLSNPLAALGSGFWLSFGSVAFLLWLGRWQLGQHRARQLLWLHSAMALAMLPLGAGIFGGASLVAAPANLLLVPLMGLYIVPLALLAVALSLLGLAVDSYLWQLAALPLQCLLQLAANSTEARWLFHHFSPTTAESLLAAAAVALLMVPQGRAPRLLVLLLLLPLLVSPAMQSTSPRLLLFDVGQGTAVLISAGGRGLLYDTGGGDPVGVNMARTVVLPYLRSTGLRALDTLVISHWDNDHSAGATALLAALPVDRLRYGSRLPGVDGGRLCRSGESWRWPGGISFRFLSPADEPGLASNDSSCVLQVQLPGHRILLAGDIGVTRERELVRYWGAGLASDSLLVSHHGSRTSSALAWLKHVRPDIAWLSYGYANRFGHPHPKVVTRLRGQGAALYSTARQGALELVPGAGERPQVSAWRAGFQPWWM